MCWWRVIVVWQSGRYSPTGQPEQLLDVASPDQLRRVVLAARRDPRVRGHRYWLHREWDDTDAPQHCSRGHELMPGRAGGRLCLCGVGHFVTDCFCGAVEHLPPLGPDCGELPFDLEAGRHHW